MRRTIRRTVGGVGLVLTLVALRPSAADAQEPSPVAAERSEYMLRTACAPVTVLVPLTATSPAIAEEQPIAIRVLGRDEAEAEAAASQFSAEAGPGGRSITVRVGHADQPCGGLPEPGSYVLGLDVTQRDSPATRATLAITVVLPAATIAGSSTIKMEQEVFCPFGRCPREPKAPTGSVTLREASGDAAATDVEIGPPLDEARESGVTADFTITFDDDVTLEPGDQAALDVTAEGQGIDRVGTTTGRSEVTSPSVDGAIELDVTITRRQGPLTYVVVVLTGLLIGLLVRVLLTSYVERGRRRAQVNAELARLARAGADAPDEQLRGAYSDIVAQLRADAGDLKDATEVQAALAAAEVATATAIAAHNTRLVNTAHARDVWSSGISAGGGAVEVIETSLADGRFRLAEVDEALAAGDSTTANRLLDEQRASVTGAAVDAAKTWSQDIGDVAGRPASGRCHERLPKDVQSLFEKRRDQLGEQREILEAGRADEIGVLRRTLDQALVTVRWLSADAEAVGRDIREASTALVQQWGFTSSPTLTSALNRLTDAPAAGDAMQTARLKARTAALCEALVEMQRFLTAPANHSRVPHDAQAAFDDAVAASEYAKIAGLVDTRPTATRGPRILGERRAASPAEAPASVIAGGPADLGPPRPTTATPAPAPPLVGPSRVATVVFTVLRWVALLVLLLGSAVVVLPQAMVGTNVQLVGVFLWAFSLNLAYEGLVAATSGLGTGPQIS